MADPIQVTVRLEPPTQVVVQPACAPSIQAVQYRSPELKLTLAERGAQGEVGPQGPQGPQGVAGANYTLPTASSSTLGGIKVGANLTISNGTLSASIPPNDWANITGKPTFAAVATSGSYNSLTDQPNLSVYLTTANASTTYLTPSAGNSLYVKPASLAAVATTGNYTDLLNKPSLFSGSYTSLTNIPTTFAPPIASATVLGGVKQGANLTIDACGVISACIPSVSSDWANVTGKPSLVNTFNTRSGEISLTLADVTSVANGVYQPAFSNTTYGKSSTPLSSTSLFQYYVNGDLATNPGASGGSAYTNYFAGPIGYIRRSNGTDYGANQYGIGGWSTDSNGNVTGGSLLSASSSAFSLAAFGNATSSTYPQSVASIYGVSTTNDSANGSMTIRASGAGTGLTQCLTMSGAGACTTLNTGYGTVVFRSTTTTQNLIQIGSDISARKLSLGADTGYSGQHGIRYGGGTNNLTNYSSIRFQESATDPSIQINNAYTFDSANGPWYFGGLNVYSNRVELYTATTVNWTSSSIITQGYADSRYLLTSNFTYANLTGTPTLATVATTGSYNDLSNKPSSYVLPVATSSTLGGIIVGSNLTIANGVLSAISSGSSSSGGGIFDGGDAFDSNNMFDGGSASGN